MAEDDRVNTEVGNLKPQNPFLNFSNVNNPYRLDHGDNPAISLVTDLLTSDNYICWSRSMTRALRARNKVGFINGDFQKPITANDPLLEMWERCNDLVVSWIQNSVSASIKSSLIFVDDARELWNGLKDRYSQPNGPRIFQLKKSLAGLMQEQDTVSTYYGRLKVLWDELSLYDPIPDCSCDKLKILLDRQQRDYVIQFLMGLNETYSNVRDQVMLLDPIPPVNRIFSMVQQQELQHKLVTSGPSTDSMAMTTRRFYSDSKPSAKFFPGSKPNKIFCTHCRITGHVLEMCFKSGNAAPPLCSHCHMIGHVAEKCYKLNGYPPGHKLYGKGTLPTAHADMTKPAPDPSTDGPVNFTKQQYHQLLTLLQD